MPSSTALACARELLATEKTYAAGLKCFLDNFVYKLPKADAAVDRMSRNINGVLTVHEYDMLILSSVCWPVIETVHIQVARARQ